MRPSSTTPSIGRGSREGWVPHLKNALRPRFLPIRSSLYALAPSVGSALAAQNVVIPSGQAKMGDYQYNISGFGPGDKLVFPVFGGAPNALNTINPSPTDGIVTFQLIRNVGGQKFDITVVLNGLTAAQDQQISDVATFNAVFGANSIQ